MKGVLLLVVRVFASISVAIVLYGAVMLVVDKMSRAIGGKHRVGLVLEWVLAAFGPLGFGVLTIGLLSIVTFLLLPKYISWLKG